MNWGRNNTWRSYLTRQGNVPRGESVRGPQMKRGSLHGRMVLPGQRRGEGAAWHWGRTTVRLCLEEEACMEKDVCLKEQACCWW